MRIGARIIKTGIAVTITMFICKMFNLEPAFFGAVSAVINIQPSIFLTLKTAKDQIMIHIIGVGFGLGFGYLVGSNPIIMGFISVLIISIYKKMNLQSGITMGIVAALFVLSSGEEQFLPHALARTAVIFVGLGTAMIINISLWPPRYKNQFILKMRIANEETANYFCQAVRAYVTLGNEDPDSNQAKCQQIHKLNKEVRALSELFKQEGGLLTPVSSAQGEWFGVAERLLDYNEALAERADRIYDLLSGRFERRMKAGYPPISEEFRTILAILDSGCDTIDRINAKLRIRIIDDRPVEAEAISEDFWKRLTIAIEHWQMKFTDSYYLHALLEAAVTANELKWAAREAKRLLSESVQIRGKTFFS